MKLPTDHNGDGMGAKEIAAMCACYALVYVPLGALVLASIIART